MKDIEDRIKELEYELKELREKMEEQKEYGEPKPWKPEVEGTYFHIYDTLEIKKYFNQDDSIDNKLFKAGNCFRTKKRAKQVAEKVRLLLRMEQVHDMLCPDYEPDWNNDGELKFCLAHYCDDDCWFVDSFNVTQYPITYFDTLENAEKAVEILNKEMKRGKK